MSRELPCKHLAYKTLNEKITELFIDGEEWVRKPLTDYCKCAKPEIKENITGGSFYIHGKGCIKCLKPIKPTEECLHDQQDWNNYGEQPKLEKISKYEWKPVCPICHKPTG